MPNTKLAAAALAACLLATGAALISTPVGAMAVEATNHAPPWVGEALKKLVDDGTITQEQSRSVAKALDEAKPGRGSGAGHHPDGGRGRHPDGGRHTGGARMSLHAAAKALGMATGDLRAQLAAGKTMAQVAAERDVNVQTVVDAMVDDFKTHLAEHVAGGRITQEQADAKAARAEERFTALVNRDVRHRH